MKSLIYLLFLLHPQTALAAENTPTNQADLALEESFLTPKVVVDMASVFKNEEITTTSEIPFETTYQDDDTLEYGLEEVIEFGEVGQRVETFKVTYWREKEIDREKLGEEVIEPKERLIRRGTKIVWRDLPTPTDGVLKYWHKINAKATAYSPFCVGCSGRTYTGTIAGRGTCAVDPNQIPLGAKLYVDGYGICTAEDTGGAIKGDRVDVCFATDAEALSWGVRYRDVYLLSR